MNRGRFYLLIVMVIGIGLMLAACTPPQASGEPEEVEAGEEVPEEEAPASDGAAEEAGLQEEQVPMTAGDWQCPQGDKRLVVWHFWEGRYFESISEIFAEYEAVCPNITVDLVHREALNDDILALQQGELEEEWPDMIAWVNDQIGRHSASGFVVPVDPYIDVDEFQRNYVTTAVEAVNYDDRIWAYPESMEVVTMIFNRDLINFRDLPSDTDELLEQAEAWDKTDYYFVYNASNDAYFSAPWWQAAGVKIVDEDGNTDFTTKGRLAAEFITSLYPHLPEELNSDIADDLFKSGQAPIIMNGPWFIADVREAGIDYGLELLPTFSPTGNQATPFVGVKVLMLTARAEERGNAEAAVNVMQFYTRPEAQAQLVKDNAMIPANWAAMSTLSAEQVPDEVDVFSQQALQGKPMPSSPYMGALWEPMTNGLECLWNEEGSISDCVRLIQTEAEANIAEMKED